MGKCIEQGVEEYTHKEKIKIGKYGEEIETEGELL